MRPQPGVDYFYVVQEISNESFTGIERPPGLALKYQYDHCELFLHEIEHQVVAYALVTMDNGGPYLWSIATKKEFRGRGIASSLIKEVVAWYKERHAAFIELTVNVNNPAQKLYFDHDFRVTRITPRYYGDVSGLRMRRKL